MGKLFLFGMTLMIPIAHGNPNFPNVHSWLSTSHQMPLTYNIKSCFRERDGGNALANTAVTIESSDIAQTLTAVTDGDGCVGFQAPVNLDRPNCVTEYTIKSSRKVILHQLLLYEPIVSAMSFAEDANGRPSCVDPKIM